MMQKYTFEERLHIIYGRVAISRLLTHVTWIGDYVCLTGYLNFGLLFFSACHKSYYKISGYKEHIFSFVAHNLLFCCFSGIYNEKLLTG